MKKTYLILATAIVAFASCSDNTYMGDPDFGGNTGNGGAISFGSSTPSLTRAEGSAAATALGNSFNVYGVKTSDGTNFTNVFAKNTYSEATTGDASATPYIVSWTDNSAGTTASNTKNWEYVTSDQTIKYWDYSANHYEFVAYKATVGTPTITKYRKDGFTVAATAAELAGLYVADKLTISTKNNTPTQPATGYNQIGNIVQFTFRSSGTKVRLGIYETINGYQVQNVKFRSLSSEFTDGTGAANLCGLFNGTSSSASGTYNVTYNSTTGVAEFDNTTAASNHFEFGSFTTGAIGTSSTAPSWAGGGSSPYYQGVLPNTDNVNNMTLYVDYDLYNTSSGETIHVYGAKAVVPSIYMKWNPNYAYTYLFKISDNTNGATSTNPGTPEGLFPITFDAVTIAATDGQNVGTITTVSTPAITTYQNGSVSDAGITYANANGAIYITVNTDGTVKDLSVDNTKLYTVDAGTTEADLILGVKTKTSSDLLSILSADATSQGITFANGKAATFTPAASTTYALEYLQIDEVTGLTEGTSPVTGYYTRTGESAPYTYTKVTDPSAKAASATKYYTVVPQYKIIVGA